LPKTATSFHKVARPIATNRSAELYLPHKKLRRLCCIKVWKLR